MSGNDQDHFDLDLDAALDAWQRDFEANESETPKKSDDQNEKLAEERTRVDSPKPKPSEKSQAPKQSADRRLYSPDLTALTEIAKSTGQDSEALPDWDEEDPVEATRLAEVPKELIDSLGIDFGDTPKQSTKPPPGEETPFPDTGSFDLELDGLFNDLELPPPGEEPTEPADSTRPSGAPEPPDAMAENLYASLPMTQDATPENDAATATLDDDDLNRDVEELDVKRDLRSAQSMPTLAPGAAPPTTDSGFGLAPTEPPPSELDDEILSHVDELAEIPTQISKPPTERKASADHGAAAARRTVGYRRYRKEKLLLVGRNPETLRHRAEFLRSLAKCTKGPGRAGTLVAAAEIEEQLGNAPAAHELYREARQADPRNLIALRAERRRAFAERDWPQVARLLEAEAALPVSTTDRMHALTLLVEIQLRCLDDAAAAEQTARKAARANKTSCIANLLLAEVYFARKRTTEALTALETTAAGWKDEQGQAILLSEIARSAEQSGHTRRSVQYYARAAHADPSALDALLGLARTARAQGDIDAAVTALGHVGGLLKSNELSEALRRAAALLLFHTAQRPEDAVRLLSESQSALALRVRAEAAAGDTEEHLSQVEQWAQACGGTERAKALVTLAELQAEAGRLEDAEDSLKDAALADNTLGTIVVVREVLARRAGDSTTLARAVEASSEGRGGALAAAAKLARNHDTLARERALLEKATAESDSPATVDVLALDAAAADRNDDAVVTGLRRHAQRCAPPHRAGVLLTLCDLLRDSGEVDAALSLLRQAYDSFPDDPLIRRSLARTLEASDPIQSAELWLSEAQACDGFRAAFAATTAGRRLIPTSEDPLGPLRAAIDVTPLYPPAAWCAEPIARKQENFPFLSDVHIRLATESTDPHESAGRLVRAALLEASSDAETAQGWLEQAQQHCPDDLIVASLWERLGGQAEPSERARRIDQAATAAPDELRDFALVAAATAFRDSGDSARAAELYRNALERNPELAVVQHVLELEELKASQSARVAERRFTALRSAESDEEKVAALDALAWFDLLDRKEDQAGILSLESLLELNPNHLPSLRTLERYFMNQARDGELLATEEQLVKVLSHDGDTHSHARFMHFLLERREAHTQADSLIKKLSDEGHVDLWTARQRGAIAHAEGEHTELARCLEQLAACLDDPLERASIALEAARALEKGQLASALDEAEGDLEKDDAAPQRSAAALLAQYVSADLEHPIAHAELARLWRAYGDQEAAAKEFELAAQQAQLGPRATALWYRAGTLWEQDAAHSDRAISAYANAIERDITYLDLFERQQRLLRAAGRTSELLDLTSKRLVAGGDTATLVALHIIRSEICDELSDPPGAREALRAALSLDPEHAKALRRLADLNMHAEDWRGAAEALIRIARLKSDREELRRVFFSLGDIYERHMPDAKRAEAAFGRVLKLVPNDREAMHRLAELHLREGQVEKAAALLERLANLEVDGSDNWDDRFRLATAFEQIGEHRKAEGVLEKARRERPTELPILRALMDFYRRQNAQAALSMHLNRAVNDFRSMIADHPHEARGWNGLVEVLDWRTRKDAARCAASGAAALGLLNVDLSRRVNPNGGVPGLGRGAMDPELQDHLTPPKWSRATAEVFRLASEAFEKVWPVDLKKLRTERLSGRKSPLAQEAQQVAGWFGVDNIQILMSTNAPRICVPIRERTLTIVLGHELPTLLNEGERVFLLARTIKIATENLAVSLRLPPGELALGLAALIQALNPNYQAEGVDQSRLGDMGKRLTRALSRRARAALGPVATEMGGQPGADLHDIGEIARDLGNRASLAAMGSLPAAITSLLKLSTVEIPDIHSPEARSEMVQRNKEAWDLLMFGISDSYFEMRRRAGAEQL